MRYTIFISLSVRMYDFPFEVIAFYAIRHEPTSVTKTKRQKIELKIHYALMHEIKEMIRKRRRVKYIKYGIIYSLRNRRCSFQLDLFVAF